MKYLPSFYLRNFFFLILAFLLGTELLLAQVTIAPSMLFIDSKSGIGNLYITNNSASPQEVSISFVFGFPDADSAGNAKMNYNDTVAAEIYSLNPIVRAFPRSFLLDVKQAQTVRLQVRTKSNVKDASFFSRVKVSSTLKTPDIGKKTTDAVTTQINFKFDQIFPVFYRKGNVSTGVIVHDVSTTLKDNKFTVITDIERTGNTPYIGSIKAELFSAANETVALFEETASIYFRSRHKMELDVSKAAKGKHRLVLTFETKRSDVSAEDLLQAPTVTKEVTVNLE